MKEPSISSPAGRYAVRGYIEASRSMACRTCSNSLPRDRLAAAVLRGGRASRRSKADRHAVPSCSLEEYTGHCHRLGGEPFQPLILSQWAGTAAGLVVTAF